MGFRIEKVENFEKNVIFAHRIVSNEKNGGVPPDTSSLTKPHSA